jgi:microcystin degradation protein MlrC
MRIFTASLATETNTFSPIPTGMASFEEYGVTRGARGPSSDGVGLSFAYELGELARAHGHVLVESIIAFAQPAGVATDATFETLRDAILADLKGAGEVDFVLLFLHGAMVAQSHDDCEGELLAEIREIVGAGVPLGALVDCHCHYSERMRESADCIIAFKHYPHTDGWERCKELYRVLANATEGRIKPVTAVHDCRTVGLFHTSRSPMAEFVERMKSLEGKDGILSISLGHGFPWGDVADNGAKIWVTADGDWSRAAACAAKIGREFEAIRDKACASSLPLATAIDQALMRQQLPVVLADVADNPGGGAAGDSTFILTEILKRSVTGVALGGIWDPQAVDLCFLAGAGSSLRLRIGGKAGPYSGDPLDLEVRVMALRQDHSQKGLLGRTLLGRSAWVKADDCDLLLISNRVQIMGRDAFSGLGIDLEGRRLVVVKSAHHFSHDFAALCAAPIYVSTPGVARQDFANIAFVKRDGDYWPRTSEPSHG